jgi:DNA-directed RNA polymerase specialized sigma subunit
MWMTDMAMRDPERYEVNVRRDGRFWYIEIPVLDGATQARNLREVDEMARDYISSVADVPGEEVELAVTIELSAEVQAHLAAASALRDEAAHARSRAAEESRAAAQALKSQGLTVREVGTALGISHQRAQQLISA